MRPSNALGMEDSLHEALARLRAELALPRGARRRFVVGAAIGTGMAAQSATRGGADFLLALSAGRMRCIGEPSVAAMLPLRNSNDFVMGFAPTEILPRARIPVFFGACAFDPRLDLAALVERVAAAGFGGVANFPTAVLVDGAYRAFLERSGFGFGRELELLALARARGLATLAYIKTEAEAVAAAERGVDIVNVDLGWNVGGVLGAASDLRLEEAAVMVNRVARRVRATAPATRCTVEGGPIVSPRQLEEFCQIADVDGYVGGSTIDRVPLEAAIEVVTAAFKAIGVLRRSEAEAGADQRRFPVALWGRSRAAEDARALFAQVSPTEHPVAIVGEPGSGRREVARALHTAGPRKARDLVVLRCADRGTDDAAERLRLELVGCAAGALPYVVKHRLGALEVAHGSSLLLDDADALPREVQGALADIAEAGRFRRVGAETSMRLNVRFLAVARDDLRRTSALDPRFAEWLGCFTIALPPLRERPEDLPTLIDQVLRQIEVRLSGPRRSVDPSAFRLLAGHGWPGNLRELAAVLERASLACPGDTITEAHLPPLAAGRAPLADFRSEMDWILHGLRENRFRRGRAAAYLGISRKTLYNKMRAYGLLAPERAAPR